MGKAKRQSQGFTLITSLLLLIVMSGVAVGLLYMVNGAGRVGGNDMEANVAYYGAEAGMEKLTTDLASLYSLKLAPTQADLDALAATSAPSGAQIGGMTYVENAKWTVTNPDGSPKTGTSIINSGPNQGLMAEIVPITLQVTAVRPTGASVNMTRGIQIALIPVFQFGVFSDSDLSYFPGPPFMFAGRVHTNGNLFLAADSGPLFLGSKVTAVGEIIRDRLVNNFNNGANYQGSVYVSNTNGGCDTAIATKGGTIGPSCLDFGRDNANATNDASWSGGIPPAGTANVNWAGGTNISTSTFNGMIGNAASIGVQPLQLPFVQGATGGTADQQIQIIRRPLPGESASSPLGASREYNKANIHILLADTQAGLRPGSPPNDGEDVDLTVNCTPTTFPVAGGIATGTAWAATAQDPTWVRPPAAANSCNAAQAVSWPLYTGWLRVEYEDNAGTWHGITNEWLGLGFARGVLPPSLPVTTGGIGSNGVNPAAILILQQQADRNGNGVLDNPSEVGLAPVNGNYSWYPINFYDEREGFPRDNTLGGTQCYTNGIMNVIELDVGNLRQWLFGNGPYAGLSGTKVDPSPQNGYLLYFSDRRGMWPNPNSQPIANVVDGKAGLEDDVNSATGNGMPDGNLEPITAGYNVDRTSGITYGPEDVDENGKLDNWGWHNMAEGFGSATPAGNPYVSVDCWARGRQNRAAGVRHALRLVDGSLNNVPTKANGQGGFTVASENPVYVLGNYNSSAADPFWANPPANADPAGGHSAAAVIADSVTLLSNGWSDVNDMSNVNNLSNRNATNTYYRMAIASGKNMNFPYNNWRQDFGTDGGVHNFLRYLEDWSNNINSNYRGSLISLYYSEYATGIFKCCTTVYSPPNRNYFFDVDFLVPTNLPPGTPLLQDINNLTYWQSFNPCTAQSSGNCTN